jgi:hypothetical protein
LPGQRRRRASSGQKFPLRTWPRFRLQSVGGSATNTATAAAAAAAEFMGKLVQGRGPAMKRGQFPCRRGAPSRVQSQPTSRGGRGPVSKAAHAGGVRKRFTAFRLERPLDRGVGHEV